VKETVARNRSMGSPVDIRIQLSHADTAALSRRASIYLHTYSTTDPYGMPISIAEAMASGSYIVGWRCPAAEAYIGEAGATYATEDQAVAFIRETERWSEEDWLRAEVRSIDRAFARFVDSTVLRPMLDDWLAIAAESRCVPAERTVLIGT
jgi:glycosyltransferase involved in cell wall biosynthesis